MSAANTISKINRRLQVRLKVALREAAKEVIQVVIDVIKLRTQQEGQGKGGKFDALKESTIKYRERYASRLSKDTDPRTSNVTATGQMIDAITGKSSGNKVEIFIKNTKRRKELSGGKSGLTNNQVREYVEKQREFLVLTDQERKEAIDVATQIIVEKLRTLS